MTENKRFMIEKSSIVEDGFFICDNTGKFSFPTTKDKSDLIMYVKQLNELHEEINYLKKKKCDYWNKYNQAYLDSINFKKENEQLKSALKELKEIGDYQAERIKELDEENQQIENSIQEAYQSERTALGRSVLKQLMETIQ